MRVGREFRHGAQPDGAQAEFAERVQQIGQVSHHGADMPRQNRHRNQNGEAEADE